MKKHLKLLLLVALLASYCLPTQAQSTEGKEFWVGLTWAVTPPDKKKKEATDPYYQTAKPYIAVSAKGKGTKITLTNPAFPNWSVSYTTQEENEWHEFTTTDIPYQYWYPDDMKTIADFSKYADVTKPWGIKVNSNHNISVSAVVRANYGMDASNVLPTSALRSEYYIQDFFPEYNIDEEVQFTGPAITMATILATEDNTKIDIYPTGNTYGKNNAGTAIPTITLNKGEIYYLLGADKALISGTRIVAQDNKPIAVFIGDPITRLPAGVGARDALYEQAMPTDFWGTQFVVTRSLEKDANFIGITATMQGTQIYLDGISTPISINDGRGLNSGETYWIELYSPEDDNNPYTKNSSKLKYSNEVLHISQDALYIESSCPVAVYSYDTGNSYKGNNTENLSGHGDPSSVWIAPIQKKIKKITFGTCTTSKTKAHFLNIVTETASCQNTSLTGYYFANNRTFPVDISDSITWNPVDGNAKLSYARVKLEAKDASGQAALPLDVFTMENTSGFIANVYGNGEDESYAYSAGSAAVEQGVNVEGETFTDGYRSESKFCFGDSLSFDAKIGTDEISRVDWTFGDGTTEYYGTPQTKHKYTTPGWYDVTAELYGHQVCTEEDNVLLGRVQFSFRVVRADTIPVAPRDSCLTIQQQEQIVAEKGQQHLDSLVTYGETTIINPDAPCYEDKLFSFVKYGLETERTFDSIVRDGAEIDGRWYESDAVVTWTVEKPHKCPQHFTCNLTVITCLKIDVPNNPATQSICPGENLEIPYTKAKGHISNATFSVPRLLDKADVTFDDNANNGTFILPTSSIEKAGIYKGTLYIEDHDCDSVITVPLDFTVKYPSDIFKFKFNNVLAVYQNTGYEFTAYQWVVNDEPVLDANSSIYYLGQGNTFNEGDVVYVLLTDKDGLVLPSCPQTLTDIQDYNPEPEEPAQAHKKIVNRRFVIQRGEEIYDIYGQKVK